MSKTMQCELFDRALIAGHKSNLIQKHGAIIIRNNKIVAEGTNYTRPQQIFSIHAEQDALFKLKGKSRKFMEECTMIVVRVGGPENPLKMSKPCPACALAIEKSGIKKVYFSQPL